MAAKSLTIGFSLVAAEMISDVGGVAERFDLRPRTTKVYLLHQGAFSRDEVEKNRILILQVRLSIVGVWSALGGARHSHLVSPGKTHAPSKGGAHH